ncbi:AAA-like domain-containing protein [Chroococcus sp. FPU101]|uniref:AAA-like domain-containing protein n=1 Tax=Chroococcus sp. FPU101 TaxID=1974212 RepID=UPI001A8D739B|nr:AAA-like domain-containing protein [Chroococcus sp. FPU101]GFE70386.1 diguanylate cyclase [Chroococcus sp. FPU101]
MITSDLLTDSLSMSIDEVIRLLEVSGPKKLTPLQEQVLRLAWDGSTYSQMAIALHYQEAYLKNIASALWQELSVLLNDSITKTNFADKLKSYLLSEQQQQRLTTTFNTSLVQPSVSPESPYGPVPLNSIYYIKRPPIEELTFMELHKPGGVIRLKAPSKMGKSSLLLRIIAQAQIADYHTIQIDFKEIDQSILKNLDKLLRWLCTVISRQLSLKPMLNDYWGEETGSKMNCSVYLENYILSHLEQPLVISFCDLHYIFAYPEIASNLLSLLRFWHEKAQQSNIWQKIRLILVHSTEIYIPLRFNESPFNIGLPITIPEFTLPQIQELAERHRLNWKNEQGFKKARSLMNLVGGHPYLVRLAFYYMCWREMSLETIIAEASTQTGIYREHLQNYVVLLQEYPELLSAWLKVVTSSEPVQLETITVYHLESLGLIKIVENGVVPRCELYRQFFQRQLDLVNLIDNQLKRLKEDNQRLQALCYIDEYTQTGNRRGFDQTLELEWRRMTRNQTPLALILCNIGFTKLDDDNIEDSDTDRYLKQVSQIFRNGVQRASDYIARYTDREFGIILPETDVKGATQIAERILQNIVLWESEKTLGLITHLGVACLIPKTEMRISFLVHEAQKALYRSIKMGHNTVIVSSLLDD